MAKPRDSFWLISYDVPDDKRRTALAKLLENSGVRVQYSVFEAFLTERERKKLLRDILKIVRQETDSVRFYPLCADCYRQSLLIGPRKVVEENQFVMIL